MIHQGGGYNLQSFIHSRSWGRARIQRGASQRDRAGITVESYAIAIPGFDLDQAAEQASNSVPAARYGAPLDAAKLAAFLCSDEAGFITGQTFVVDGGATALMSLISDFRGESAARFGRGYIPGR
jgi:NAD(P)-dependent dehydrogenase (short-subunit alcohol dehydrogenase family)